MNSLLPSLLNGDSRRKGGMSDRPVAGTAPRMSSGRRLNGPPGAALVIL